MLPLTYFSLINYPQTMLDSSQCLKLNQTHELAEAPHLDVHGMWSCWTASELVSLIIFLWQKSILFWYTEIRAPGDRSYSSINTAFRNSTDAQDLLS